MKTSIAVVGVIILLIGAGVLVYGMNYPSPPATTTTTTMTPSSVAVVPATSRTVDAGGLWSFGMNLQKGETVSGTASIQGYNSSAGPVFFYIQNESTFIYWGGCAPCALPSGGYTGLANYTLPSSGTYSFTWTAPYSGAFYLAFDNENYNQKANANLQATGSFPATTTTIVSSPPSSMTTNNNLVYAGAIVMVLGIIIVALGAMMKSGKPPAKVEPQAGAPTTNPASPPKR